MLKKYSYIFCLVFLIIINCSQKSDEPSRPETPKEPDTPPKTTSTNPLPQQVPFPENAQRISIMTYNVENFFDSLDDTNKNDETYLPLSIKETLPGHEDYCNNLAFYSWRQDCLYLDWTEDVVDEKAKRLAQVIKSYQNGQGPDIVVFQEVEKIEVLQYMVDTYLNDTDYSFYLIEDTDRRGIDIGLLSRQPLSAQPRLQKLKEKKRKALHVQFDLGDNYRLSLYGVHFETGGFNQKNRLEMLETLRHLSSSSTDKELTIVAGDFNFPLRFLKQDQVIDKHMRPEFTPAHLFCSNCKGTYYNSRGWNFLDMILTSKNFYKPQSLWTIDQSSFTVHSPLDIQLNLQGQPKGFHPKSKYGVSDHLPQVVEIVRTKEL